MKKYFKIFIISVLSLLVLFSIYIGVESYRLSHNSQNRPLLVTREYLSGNSVVYESIGFTIKNKYVEEDGNYGIYYCIGQDFLLFDKILLWGWIS